MPDGPEKDAALAGLAEKETLRKLKEEIEADRARIDAMPDSPEKDAALAALAEKEA